ncbi:MAG TPA: peptidase domain-containing ABC transporter [Gemmatimonadaceae bacterium]|nr:peptidase domain-containing ABC transporter [Gemmatimonadaceae bacterium]
MAFLFRRASRIKQHDMTDCGAACLWAVASHYGARVPISRIRQYASTDRGGTTVLGLLEAATRLGFTAKGVRGTVEHLPQLPTPAIAHVLVREGIHHYVVIRAVRRRRVVIMDPSDGRFHRMTIDAFAAQWTGVLLLLAPSADVGAGQRGTSLLRRFWQLVRPHATVLAQALVGALVYTLLGLSTAVYVQKLVDYVLVDANRNLLNLMSVVMIAFLVLRCYIGSLKSLITLHTGQRIDAVLILGYYQHLLQLPQRFFDTMRVGEIISRVNDAVKIRAFINDVALELAVNVLVVVLSFALMCLYSWRLALVVAGLVPAYGLVYWLINRLNRANQRQLMERGAELESQLVESLNGVATIKRFSLESYANAQTETRFVRLLRTVYRSGQTAIFAASASDLIARLFTIIMLWAGADLVIDRGMTPGALMSCYALLGYLTAPIGSLVGMNRTMQDALIAADRLFEIIDLEREAEPGTLELTPAMAGDIRLRNVSFRYGAREEVLRDLSVVIPHGALTAVVGESGSGKSTLAALLQRIYPVAAGRIAIGDHDIAHASTASLRRLVGVVSQEIDLFAGSVIDNIAIGDAEPDMEKLLGICGILGVTEFVDAMPGGFSTLIGEHGVNLSGGQRQRIAIARALYREPHILILDEATSSLDSISEQYVHHALAALRRAGRTVIVIAHRLSTVVRADKIIVLDRGRVAEEGRHEELLARRGVYAKLWRHQVAGPDVLREPDRASSAAAPRLGPLQTVGPGGEP